MEKIIKGKTLSLKPSDELIELLNKHLDNHPEISNARELLESIINKVNDSVDNTVEIEELKDKIEKLNPLVEQKNAILTRYNNDISELNQVIDERNKEIDELKKILEEKELEKINSSKQPANSITFILDEFVFLLIKEIVKVHCSYSNADEVTNEDIQKVIFDDVFLKYQMYGPMDFDVRSLGKDKIKKLYEVFKSNKLN